MQNTTPSSDNFLNGMSHQELLHLCREADVKDVHAETLNAYVFRRGITDWYAMPEIPQRLRRHLDQHASLLTPSISADQQAKDGTRKLLLAMPDGKEVETVLIPTEDRLTQCISSQVGCAVACEFCLTATAGLTRNLTTAEMLAQVMVARELHGEQARNLVLMGMGEPMHNYDAVAKFVRILTDPKGLAFSPRRITLSTAGLIPGIKRMIEDELPCNLAVSLNATTDDIRNQIMPINRKYPIAELMKSVRDYIAARDHKRVLIEYVMLKGINDSLDDAHRLVDLLGDLGCTINLLPFNPFISSPFERPDDEQVLAFRSILAQASLVAVIRASRGDEISAACGQLKTETTLRRASNGMIKDMAKAA